MRITNRDLAAVCNRLNNITGNPVESWVKTDDGFKAQVGNYHISGAYGGVSLHQMQTDGGCVRDVFSCEHIPKRDLYDRMQAYISGLLDCEDARKATKANLLSPAETTT